MIIRSENGRLRITMQVDHAMLAGEFAGAWGGELFQKPHPQATLRLAAEIHDQGWHEWDQQPRIAPESGRPYNFTGMPVADHLGIYERCIELACQRHPYAGLLVSLHGTGLYKQRYGHMPDLAHKQVEPEYREAVDRFLATQEAMQAELIRDLRADEQTLWTHYRWMQVWDALSVFLGVSDPAEQSRFSFGRIPCLPGGPEESMAVSGAGPGRYAVSPWPFEPRRLEVWLPVRYLSDRAYGSDEEFQAELVSAPTVAVRLVLGPS